MSTLEELWNGQLCPSKDEMEYITGCGAFIMGFQLAVQLLAFSG